MAKNDTTRHSRGARQRRHALNAGEYFLAYSVSVGAATVAYVVAGGGATVAQLIQLALRSLVRLIG